MGAAAIAGWRTVRSLRALGDADMPGPKTVRRHNVLAIAGQLWLLGGLAGVVLLGYDRWIMDDGGLALAGGRGQGAVLPGGRVRRPARAQYFLQ